MVEVTVVIDIEPLKRFGKALDSDLQNRSNGPIRAAFKKWAARYRAFLRDRFSRLSRGGGEWPDLAVSTLMRRRGKMQRAKVQKYLRGRAAKYAKLRTKIGRLPKSLRLEHVASFNKVTASDLFGQFKAKAAILIDTGTLFASLDPVFSGKPGQYEEDIDYGIAVGYGGTGTEPGTGKSVQEIAMYHQEGGPHLPQRKIIVPPDQSTMDGMAEDMEKAIKQVLQQTGN